jgi:probable rRNA maturation factor
MSATIEIAVESPRWDALPAAEDVVRRAIEAALNNCGQPDAEVSIALGDDAQIRELNRHWRGKDVATNVLSFPAPGMQPDEARFLGDIILAFETIEREAAEEARPLAHHVAHLAVHGTLHLLGYDHENDSDADVMERRERDILARIAVPDPYASGAARRTEPA